MKKSHSNKIHQLGLGVIGAGHHGVHQDVALALVSHDIALNLVLKAVFQGNGAVREATACVGKIGICPQDSLGN